MPTSKSELKARLLAKAEVAIDELLAHQPAPETASLAEIEQVVLKAGHQIEQSLTRALLVESGTVVASRWPTCRRCGRRLQAKGKRKRQVVTQTGEVELRRDYYHCRVCHTGVFPPR